MTQESRLRTADQIAVCVRGSILAFTLVVWTVAGFYFWIPLLARTTAAFSALLVYVTLVGEDERKLNHMIDRAIVFYIDGFSKIINAMSEKRIDRTFDHPPLSALVPIEQRQQLYRVGLEMLWAAVFWIVSAGLVWLIF